MSYLAKNFLTISTIVLLSTTLQAQTKLPQFKRLAEDSFSLNEIVEDEFSQPFSITVGKSIVKMQETKDGLKHFKLQGSGILINSGFIHKNIAENPDIVWTVPDGDNLEDGDVFSVHAFKSELNPDGSRPIDFYVLYQKTPQDPASPGIVREQEKPMLSAPEAGGSQSITQPSRPKF